MTKKLKIALAVVAAMAAIQTAGARDFGAIYTQCGLGAMIAKNSPVVAAITNVTWDLGTTAVLSNASSPEMCKGTGGKMAALIHDSYLPLEQELSQGEGEYLDALVAAADCDASAGANVISNVREDFAAQVAAPGYAVKTQFEKSEGLFQLFDAQTAQCAVKS